MDINKNDLTPEELEQVSGGYVIKDEKMNKYGVLRQDGTLLAPAPTLDKAVEYVKSFHVSPQVMTPEEYKDRFGRDLKW
ncbi:MAG: hypothetical protein K6G58_07805 [Lachnospiraceae bacterium]|nr:hypothetical protein [Lachnospiraceae bacterium]